MFLRFQSTPNPLKRINLLFEAVGRKKFLNLVESSIFYFLKAPSSTAVDGNFVTLTQDSHPCL